MKFGLYQIPSFENSRSKTGVFETSHFVKPRFHCSEAHRLDLNSFDFEEQLAKFRTMKMGFTKTVYFKTGFILASGQRV